MKRAANVKDGMTDSLINKDDEFKDADNIERISQVERQGLTNYARVTE
jgi:hypothetical protein